VAVTINWVGDGVVNAKVFKEANKEEKARREKTKNLEIWVIIKYKFKRIGRKVSSFLKVSTNVFKP
jgi:hypothetical protein